MTGPQAREFSQEERERLASQGKAMPDGSYPIVTREDLENAIQAIGRAKDPAATKRHIKKRAAALGLSELIPEEWGGGGQQDWSPRRPQARASKDWYRIENKAGAGSDVYIYDEIGGFGVSAGDFLGELRNCAGDVRLHLNSPGGDVFDGMAIYQALRNRVEPTTVHIDGLAASIASVIAMGADRVVMAPKAQFMIHEGWSAAVGNAADMRKLADLLDRTSDSIASVYADKAGQTTEFWRDRMREETWYSADEAMEAGLVDEVEGKPRKREFFDLAQYNYSGRDSAPAPVLKGEPGPELVDLKDEGPTAEPVVESKEPEPFTWDFAAFKSSLKEGIRG